MNAMSTRGAGAVPVPYSSNTTARSSSDSRQRNNALSSKPGTMRNTNIFVSICVNALHLCSDDGANARSYLALSATPQDANGGKFGDSSMTECL